MPISAQNRVFTLHQATQNAPTLARLSERIEESNKRLRAIESLIPAPLRSAIKAGPIDHATWCLLVGNSAVAAKMRQLIPSMEFHLKTQGCGVHSIRLKIQSP